MAGKFVIQRFPCLGESSFGFYVIIVVIIVRVIIRDRLLPSTPILSADIRPHRMHPVQPCYRCHT